MVEINKQSNFILKNGKKIIKLPTDAADVLTISQLIVILLKNMQADNDRNIVCYDLNGNFKWQVPDPIKLHSENYFVGVELRENQLYAYSINGVEYHLDLATGDILESQLVNEMHTTLRLTKAGQNNYLSPVNQ